MSTQALTLATPAERAVRINELQVKVATRLAARATSLVVEVMRNMPEYCINHWFRICDWDYENKSYTFQVAPPPRTVMVTYARAPLSSRSQPTSSRWLCH